MNGSISARRSSHFSNLKGPSSDQSRVEKLYRLCNGLLVCRDLLSCGDLPGPRDVLASGDALVSDNVLGSPTELRQRSPSESSSVKVLSPISVLGISLFQCWRALC
jgi:hypothetical protein